MQPIPQHFDETQTVREKILYTLSLLHKGSAEEIASEIAELQGLASEEGVAEMNVAVEKEIEKLLDESKVEVVKEHRQKKRYALAQKNVSNSF